MKLPNCKQAYIASSKISDYLLDVGHPAGQSKARFFRLVGFDESTIDKLHEGLLEIAREEDVIEVKNSIHGMKYVIDGMLSTPADRQVSIRTIWIIDAGYEIPRFVTAYPH